MSFFSSKRPSPPPMPAAVPPQDKKVVPPQDKKGASGEDTRKAVGGRRRRRETILTGALGLTSPANVGRRTLLGG